MSYFGHTCGMPITERPMGPCPACKFDRAMAAIAEFLPGEEREPVKVDQRPNGCWAACVATITGIPLDELSQEIPADASDEWFWEHKTELHNDMIHKLRSRNWRLEYVWRDAPRGFAIASGQSPRLATVQHAVVAKDGRLWHDPHPSRAGLLVVESFEILIPFVYTFGPDDRRPLPPEVKNA